MTRPLALAPEDAEKLRAFVDELFDDYPHTFPDGFDIMDIAERHGILNATEVTEPCREAGCNCEDFPGTCYRLAPFVAPPTPNRGG